MLWDAATSVCADVTAVALCGRAMGLRVAAICFPHATPAAHPLANPTLATSHYSRNLLAAADHGLVYPDTFSNACKAHDLHINYSLKGKLITSACTEKATLTRTLVDSMFYEKFARSVHRDVPCRLACYSCHSKARLQLLQEHFSHPCSFHHPSPPRPSRAATRASTRHFVSCSLNGSNPPPHQLHGWLYHHRGEPS